jgi:hypothetical protein
MKRGAGEPGGEFPFQHLFAAAVPGGDPVPQIPHGLQFPNLAPPDVERLRHQSAYRNRFARLRTESDRCREESVPSGQIENRGVLGRAVGDDTVEAGLPGAGQVRGQFADIPLRDQTLGYGRIAVRSSDLAAFEPEAAIGNPRFDEFTSGGHCCRTKNVTTITDYRLQVSAQNGAPEGHEEEIEGASNLDGCRRERFRGSVFETVLRVKIVVTAARVSADARSVNLPTEYFLPYSRRIRKHEI